jgi:membrane dipeptidase
MSDFLTLHHSLLTLDSHVDIPWPEGPAFAAEGSRRVDLPKLRRGGMKAVCLAAYVPQGRRDAAAATAAFARATAMLDAIRALEAEGTRVCTSSDAILRAEAEGRVAIVPVVENGAACGDDLGRLAALRALGACYLTLTHNGHNALADSAQPCPELGDAEAEHGGLSALGRRAVAELNRLGMLVDVSHAAKTSMLQAVAASRAPVVASHSCMRALCDHPRNLDDEQLDALAASGGVVQITAVPSFLRPDGTEATVTVADFVDHVAHAVTRAGVEHVGIASDFDGGGGFVGWHDAGESPNLTAELVRRGFGRRELALLWGGNFLRALRAAEAAA